MSRNIEVIVSTGGDIRIDAVGFKGADCEKATRFLEVALGQTAKKVKKPEYYAHTQQRNVQRLGT